jgi:hypothetical protein
MLQKRKNLPAVIKADPFWLAKTPGMLRARIDVKEQMLKQAHPLSDEAWRLHQQIADLSRDLHRAEGKN